MKLRFSLRAWAKLQYVLLKVDQEVIAFGITDGQDLLAVRDFWLPGQYGSVASASLDEESFAEEFEKRAQEADPVSFARIFLHTHPDMSPEPSGVDEKTFQEVFGKTNWAVLFILARNGETWCRCQGTVEVAGDRRVVRLEQEWEVDYGLRCALRPEDWQEWGAEIEKKLLGKTRGWGEVSLPQPAGFGLLLEGSGMREWAKGEAAAGNRDVMEDVEGALGDRFRLHQKWQESRTGLCWTEFCEAWEICLRIAPHVPFEKALAVWERDPPRRLVKAWVKALPRGHQWEQARPHLVREWREALLAKMEGKALREGAGIASDMLAFREEDCHD